MKKLLFFAICILSVNSLPAMVRAGVNVGPGPDPALYGEGVYYDTWYGPGYYYGVYYADYPSYYAWRSRYYYGGPYYWRYRHGGPYYYKRHHHHKK